MPGKTVREILEKCLKDSGAEGYYQTDVAISALKSLLMKAIGKDRNTEASQITNSKIQEYFDKGYNQAKAEIRKSLNLIMKEDEN